MHLIVASHTDALEMSFFNLEAPFTFIYDVYSAGITYDDLHLTIEHLVLDTSAGKQLS